MIFIFTFIFGLVLLGFFRPKYTGDWNYPTIIYPKGWYVATAVIIMSVIAFIGGNIAVNQNNDHDIEEIHWLDLVAVADGSHTKGSFSIFSGSISEEQYYFFYYNDGNGGYKQSKVPAYKTQIIEKPDARPELIKVVDHDYGWRSLGYEAGNGSTWKIIVPEGTIVRQYNLDLEN